MVSKRATSRKNCTAKRQSTGKLSRRTYRRLKELIARDKNHPSVVMWVLPTNRIPVRKVHENISRHWRKQRVNSTRRVRSPASM
ncbi:glycoside hydrolase family 2 TIM barrel-domain containing protein [Escherichia coli]|uniref:glycoside hydrolase family 2 TIM barrel-domain containing protein n=1 Tax=Escherichia coli TaxID=562 RepID=UPI00388D32D5